MFKKFAEKLAKEGHCILTPIYLTNNQKEITNEQLELLKKEHLKSKLVMQVHDELIIETIPDEIDKVKNILKEEMENVITLNVPLDIDLNTGKSWYDAH